MVVTMTGGFSEEVPMPRSTAWSSLLISAAFCLAMPLGAAAQSDQTEEATAAPANAPELDGLAWYQSIDVTGPQIEATRDQAEVAEWAKLVEGAGATLDELEYDYYEAFDPTALPDIGEMATVRVAGAETEALRAAVVADIINQVVGLGGEAPLPQEGIIGGKDVITLSLPESMGLVDAIVYASGDVAWVLLLTEDLAMQALEQLP